MFNLRVIHIEFVLHLVAMWQVFLPIPFTDIQPKFLTHSFFYYDSWYILLIVYVAVTQAVVCILSGCSGATSCFVYSVRL